MTQLLRTSVLAWLLVAAAPLAIASEPVAEDLPDPGTTRLADSTVAIDLDLASGRPMIDLTIDGKGPFRFVVDTGASLSVLDAGIARDLSLEVVGEQVLHSPGATEEIVGDRVRAGRLEAGGLRVESPVLATIEWREELMSSLKSTHLVI